ncbi:C-terminal processing protease CtpA/Prc, contains a PDZ domain [Flavobacteriaceae bacterium MAR_2010_188]|nr:C-terminal processing protease CtpA/Prc, contains a PDZ domain [Flavobacteriaceae bacterium MAR_2010_188]
MLMKYFTPRFYRLFAAFILIIGLATSCFDDRDDNLVPGSTSVTLEIKDFVWKAMNAVYLYKNEISDLADDRFSTDEEYNAYLNSFDTPEELFESLIYQRETVDRFSLIVDDYVALEQQLSGVYKTNGLEYFLYLEPGSNDNVFVIVRLVLHDSPAEEAGIERGDIITGINGIELNRDNYIDLLFGSDSFTLNFGNYDDNGTDILEDDTVTSNSESITLAARTLNENPVYQTNIFEVDGKKVGYLVYNGFTNEYDNQLNDAFGFFKSNNVEELILDIRYNGGGSVQSASYLGSMITGQFNGDVFSKLVYNDNLQSLNSEYKFSSSFGGNSINSLGLDRVYVIATGNSASASELLINSLGAYINVIHVGSNTVGKTQASITVYDSPDLGRQGANPAHTYALQPLVATSVNLNNQPVPGTGLTPDILVNETPRDFDLLGDPEERLLAAALADIAGNGRFGLRVGDDFIQLESGKKEFPNTGLIIDNPGNLKKSERFKISQ